MDLDNHKTVLTLRDHAEDLAMYEVHPLCLQILESMHCILSSHFTDISPGMKWTKSTPYAFFAFDLLYHDLWSPEGLVLMPGHADQHQSKESLAVGTCCSHMDCGYHCHAGMVLVP